MENNFNALKSAIENLTSKHGSKLKINFDQMNNNFWKNFFLKKIRKNYQQLLQNIDFGSEKIFKTKKFTSKQTK